MKSLLVLIILQAVMAIFFWIKALYAPYEDIFAETFIVINLAGMIINSITFIKS